MMNQALKHKEKSLTFWCGKYRSVNRELKSFQSCRKYDADMHCDLRRFRKTKQKHYNISKLKHDTSHVVYNTVSADLLRQAEKLASLNEEVRYWRNEATKNQDPRKPQFHILKQSRMEVYKTEIREASYILQSLGVSQKHVSEAIRHLLKSLTATEVVGSLPSYGTYNTCREVKLKPTGCRSS